MPVTVEQFWTLLAASGLHAPVQCEQLREAAMARPGMDTLERLTAWLVQQGQLTAYQASVLASGRSGPFVLGPLVITDRVQQGRLARLFRARYEGTEVMLVPLSQLTRDASQYPALAELAKASAEVKHRHVSRTFRATRQSGQAVIIIESLSGRSLAELQSADSRSIASACQLVLNIATGLAAMHVKGLVHGSVCPQNILVAEDGNAKLLQFPLVPPADRAVRFDQPLINYLAPEWSAAEASPTFAVDIYALGCLLFELITGQPPFVGGNPRQTVERHRREIPQRLDELNPQVSPYLADLVDEMLAKDPGLRCPSMARLVEILKPLVAEAERAGSTTAPPSEQTIERPVAGAIVVPAGTSQAATPLPASNEQPEFVFDTSAATTGIQRSRRKSRGRLLGAVGGLIAVLVTGVLLVPLLKHALVSEQPPATAVATTPAEPVETQQIDRAAEPAPEAPTEAADNVYLVDDDGRTLWQSPTTGKPLSLDYLPSGAQTIAVVRPAELLSSPEGEKLVAALGPSGAVLLDRWRQTLGVDPEKIEELVVAFVPDESLQPRAAYRVRLVEPLPRSEWMTAWKDPAPREHAGRKYFERDGLTYYFPHADDDSLVTICPAAMMPQMLELEGQPLLRNSMEKLLATSDDQRLVTLLFVPNFLLTDGQSLLVGGLDHLRPVLRELVDERIDAASLSAFIDADFYLEFRAVAPVERKPADLLSQVEVRWRTAADRVESHLAATEAEPHAAELLRQFPQMLRTAQRFTRGSVDQRQAVLSLYLPAGAAHNLVMAGELALWASGESAAAPQLASETSPRQPASELLARRISLSFPRDTLDGALAVLSREIDLPIVIQGNDLQSEGITRNQSLNDFNERDQPADAVLRKLLLLANPAGKLVYQIKTDAAGRETVLITTRSAVARRGERPADGF